MSNIDLIERCCRSIAFMKAIYTVISYKCIAQTDYKMHTKAIMILSKAPRLILTRYNNMIDHDDSYTIVDDHA